MNIEPLKVDPDLAELKLKKLRASLRKLRQSQANSQVAKDTQILINAYRQLAEGAKVIDIHQAFKEEVVGVIDTGLPAAAIAKATAEEVKLCDWYGTVAHFNTRNDSNTKPGLGYISIDLGYRKPANFYSARVTVPKVPVEISVNHDLNKLLILFEVTKWQIKNVERDPYLLKHLGGSFYEVVAQWDVTDVEAAMMRHAIIVG